MKTSKLLKASKRIAIVLLIAAFNISCGGAGDISSSRGGSFVENLEAPNPAGTGLVKPEQSIFPNNTYYEIYAPFITSENNYLQVSYLDTNTLNDYWKKHVKRAGSNDNIQWIIRDGDNRKTDPRIENYYYFDKNADIIYAIKYTDNLKVKLKVKEFVGGVIVKTGIDYNGNTHGVYTIGGLYRYVLNKYANNSQGERGYTKYENNNLNEFMRAIHDWNEGDLTVILMNTGFSTKDSRYSFPFSYEFGVDEYYCMIDNNYRKDPSYFLGKNPTNYLGKDGKSYIGEKLNVRVNHSWRLDKFNFRFTMAEAYSWWSQ